jgi:hypothetical protein
VAQVVKPLLFKHKFLSSNPNPTKNREREREREEREDDTPTPKSCSQWFILCREKPIHTPKPRARQTFPRDPLILDQFSQDMNKRVLGNDPSLNAGYQEAHICVEASFCITDATTNDVHMHVTLLRKVPFIYLPI